jgi:hypothetical protein
MRRTKMTALSQPSLLDRVCELHLEGYPSKQIASNVRLPVEVVLDHIQKSFGNNEYTVTIEGVVRTMLFNTRDFSSKLIGEKYVTRQEAY